jgi:hypothetical protein
MKAKTLQQKATFLKNEIKKVAQLMIEPISGHGRDAASANQSTNWNKGWGKYGKT